MKAPKNNGITVLEILFSIAILVLILAIVIPQFSKIRENQVMKDGVAYVLSSVDKARSQTLDSLNSSEYGVHFTSDKIMIFRGTAYVAWGVVETINIISPATISNIALTGGGSDVYFNRLSGAPSATGTITITSPNFSKVITISATGLASVN